MISYKLQLRPPGLDASLTTVAIEGRACCPHSLKKIANNAGVMFTWAQTTSLQAVNDAGHEECATDSPDDHILPDDADALTGTP